MAALKDDLDGAGERLALVLQLPPELRIATVTGYLQDMDALLRDRPLSHAGQAVMMREQIEDLL